MYHEGPLTKVPISEIESHIKDRSSREQTFKDGNDPN